MMHHYNIIDTDCYLRTTHTSLNSQMIFDQEYEKNREKHGSIVSTILYRKDYEQNTKTLMHV